MRYLIFTYYRKADGKIDEVMSVSRNLKPRDLQTANVILDFQEQRVRKCMIDGQTASQDWDHVVSYYYQHYTATIERLFEDNGHVMSIVADKPAA
jgi:hypothetical protein